MFRTTSSARPRESVSRVMDTAELLYRFWGMRAADVGSLGGRINSETWLFAHRGSNYVAKSVSPTAVDDLVAGCEVAAALAEVGFTRTTRAHVRWQACCDRTCSGVVRVQGPEWLRQNANTSSRVMGPSVASAATLGYYNC
jgi:hypothetical protein